MVQVRLHQALARGRDEPGELAAHHRLVHLLAHHPRLRLYGILWLVGPSWPLGLRLVLATAVEVSWEIFENTEFVIDRYREATIALDYYGDSVVNSQMDVLATVLGFLLAARLPVWATRRSRCRDGGLGRVCDPGQSDPEHHHADLPVRSDQGLAARGLIAGSWRRGIHMKLTATIARSLQADMQAELRDIERAVATGTRDAGRGLKTELRRQVRAPGSASGSPTAGATSTTRTRSSTPRAWSTPRRRRSSARSMRAR